MADQPTTSPLPRWPLVALCPIHAGVFGVAAAFLPWPSFTLFALLAGALASFHLVTAGLALAGSRRRAMAWRLTALLSLGVLAYLTYGAIGSGLYVNQLYDGVGLPVLGAAVAAWCVGALFLLPLSIWGLAVTGGSRSKGASKMGSGLASATGLSILGFTAALDAGSARGRAHLDLTDADLDARVASALASLPAPANRKEQGSLPSLFTKAPVTCAEPPHTYSGVTAFVTRLVPPAPPEKPKERMEVQPLVECLQADSLDGVLAAVRSRSGETALRGDVIIDVVTRSRALPDAGPLLGPVVVRPAVEGVCRAERCLLPWQLVGLDAFTEAMNLSAMQAQIGVTAEALRKHLEIDGKGFADLDAFATRSYLFDGTRARPMRYLEFGKRPLDTENLSAAIRDAAGFIVASQVKDGRFRYTVDPYSGRVSFDNFSVPRQAGTTLALCEASAFDPKAIDAARLSTKFLAGLAQTRDGRAGVVFPRGARTGAPLGSTALSLISMLACREKTGTDIDRTIEDLGRGVLSMQAENGRFLPAWDPTTGNPKDGKAALYAAGQAVFALVLWEGKAGDGLERPAGLSKAIDRAMAYYSGPYWDIPIRDFFYLEENWHCLAAVAALDHHRNDAYEKFCIDYMTMKKRFVRREGSGVEEEHVGAYGFGDLFPPHHAAAAGFSEALAASITLKRARHLDTSEDEAILSDVLSYLMRHQWRDDNCFLCTRRLRIPGGFSENVGSPIIRIDFVQHAMSGLVHGGRELGLI
ncbi:MAG: hypothetical protein U0271_25755 [Polyangiaceae bacterium]